jgi:nitrogen fixation NifU-like protein
MNGIPYSAPVWEHFDKPRNIGSWLQSAPDVVTGEAGTPAGAARLRIQLRIVNGKIQGSRFQAYGGVAVIAAGSWLSEWLQGRSLAEARGLESSTIAERLELPAVERFSAVMACDALCAALASDHE